VSFFGRGTGCVWCELVDTQGVCACACVHARTGGEGAAETDVKSIRGIQMKSCAFLVAPSGIATPPLSFKCSGGSNAYAGRGRHTMPGCHVEGGTYEHSNLFHGDRTNTDKVVSTPPVSQRAWAHRKCPFRARGARGRFLLRSLLPPCSRTIPMTSQRAYKFFWVSFSVHAKYKGKQEGKDAGWLAASRVAGIAASCRDSDWVHRVPKDTHPLTFFGDLWTW